MQEGLNVRPAKFLELVSRRKSGMERALAGDAFGADISGDPVWQQAYQLYEERKQELLLLVFDVLLVRVSERIENGQVNDGWE